MQPYSSESPRHLVYAALPGGSRAAVDVAELRAARPIPGYWLRVGSAQYPLFELPGHSVIVDAYTRARLLSEPAGAVVPVLRRPTTLGVLRAATLDPERPTPAALAAMFAQACDRLPGTPPPASLVLDLLWEGCAVARECGRPQSEAVDAVVQLLGGGKAATRPVVVTALDSLLRVHKVRYTA